ncbi:acyl-CoA carboxylase epsilon subunit [Kitasatospora sp. NPDC094028]
MTGAPARAVPPPVRVLRGAPSPEDLAVLTGVLAALAARGGGRAAGRDPGRAATWQRVRAEEIRPGSWMALS